jgi:hypothetical protein
MDLRRHWWQDGRMRSHCSVEGTERVFLKKKERDRRGLWRSLLSIFSSGTVHTHRTGDHEMAWRIAEDHARARARGRAHPIGINHAGSALAANVGWEIGPNLISGLVEYWGFSDCAKLRGCQEGGGLPEVPLVRNETRTERGRD